MISITLAAKYIKPEHKIQLIRKNRGILPYADIFLKVSYEYQIIFKKGIIVILKYQM